ncbi:hypothetical protein GRS96_17150 [Rathayibacter sp. VKM Ac-2803]|uniref:hypothetical protein n=1 Tax=unclassified Rathayibacter TaxID=2609250 RepID=UPI0013586D13|nr:MULTISPECIES: hypothetical protein [unclassified Rathayibacter]MWV50998.1 hypothetical protein [Rathayibacter sp. VKM Ac-2803]MWV57487.1 hypothetical protein [Rathayibacter sp. VKM Ac-2754]
MSSSDNDIEPTLIETDETTRQADPATSPETPAGLDEVGGSSPDGAAGVDANGDEVNPPLPDWGPTDGVHGTDAETDASGTATP